MQKHLTGSRTSVSEVNSEDAVGMFITLPCVLSWHVLYLSGYSVIIVRQPQLQKHIGGPILCDGQGCFISCICCEELSV